MKKSIVIVFIQFLLAMFLNVETIYAQDNLLDLPINDIEMAENQEGMQTLLSEMLEDWNRLPLEQEGETVNFSEKDIDFSKAVKVYMNGGILTHHLISTNDVLKNLKDSGCCWLLPIYIGDHTLEFTIEEIANSEWKINAVNIIENEHVDYRERLLNVLNKSDLEKEQYRYALVGGLEGIHYPVAIGFGEAEVQYIIPVDEAAKDAFSNGEAYNRNVGKTIDDFPVYLFGDVQEAYTGNVTTAEGAGGGSIDFANLSKKNANYTPVIVLVIVLGIAIIFSGMFLYKKRKRLD